MNNYNFYPAATAPIQPQLSANQPQSQSNQFMMPQQPMMYSQPTQQMPQFPPIQNNTLNGKIVDSIDLVRVTEVPIGGYGVFPKADFSEVYIKAWNPNGTTSIYCFKPCAQQEQPQVTADVYNKILMEIEQLKTLFEQQGQSSSTTFVSPQVEKTQKEVRQNDY